MIKKNITYRDFDGEERTDTFYFNLTEAEVLELELEYNGNIGATMTSMLEHHDAKGLLGIITNIIKASYGEKTTDGKRFIKNRELTESFTTTGAYSELVLGMLSDEKEFQNFLTSVIPSNVREKVEEKLASKEAGGAELSVVGKPVNG